MSLFTHIAFPRKADTSCLKSNIDHSKMVKVKDLKGTKWEKDYRGVPENAGLYLGNFGDLEELQIYDKDSQISFKKVFENQYIYAMNAKFEFIVEPLISNASIKEILDEIEKQDGIRMTEKEYLKQSEEYSKQIIQENMKHATRCRKQLYDVVRFNTNPGEIVEIYSGWDSGMTVKDLKRGMTAEKFFKNYTIKFGPPKEKRQLTLEEVLISELLDLHDGLKIEICNTK